MSISFINDYYININSATHWSILVLILLGLLITIALVYRRFYPLYVNNLKSNFDAITDNHRQPRHLRFLLVTFGNVVAAFALVLFLLPIEVKTENDLFDVLITPGTDYLSDEKRLNLQSHDDEGFISRLKSARFLWLLVKNEQQDYSKEFLEHLKLHYQNKLIVIRTPQELTQLWQQKTERENHFPFAQAIPPQQLIVVGDGLNAQQWQKFNDKSLTDLKLSFYPSSQKLGVVKLNWQKELPLGADVTITGKLQTPERGSHQYRVSLWQHQQLIESSIINENGYFQLQVTPKVSGLFTYQLAVHQIDKNISDKTSFHNDNGSGYRQKNSRQKSTRQKDNEQKSAEVLLKEAYVVEPVSFNILEPNKVKVVIKQSSPSFETRQLKQWLSHTGNSVKVFSQISRDKWSQQYHNFSADEKNKSVTNSHLLTVKMLEETDWLLLDSRALLNLTENELKVLEAEVYNGLGLYVIADKSLMSAQQRVAVESRNLLSAFNVQSIELSEKQVMPLWPNLDKMDNESPILTTAAEVSVAVKGGQVLVESARGRELVSSYQLGLGKITISTLSQTYPWAIEFGNELYSQYWQYMLTQSSRAETSTYWLKPVEDKLHYAGGAESWCLVTDKPKVYANKVQLSPYPLLNSRQCGLYIGKSSGWASVDAFDSNNQLIARQSRYIYPKTSYIAWQQAVKHQTSINFNELKSAESKVSYPVARLQAVNKLYLWLVLFIALVFLWLERKWLTG